MLGLAAGILYGGLIPLVMMAVSPSQSVLPNTFVPMEILGFEVNNYGLAILFFTVCLAILLFSSVSEIILNRLALDIKTQLRRDIYRRIRQSSIVNIDTIGRSRLIESLSTDVPSIIMGAQALPSLLTNVVVIVSMLGYLAYLNAEVFYFVLKALTVGSILFQIIVYFGNKCFSMAREGQDRLQKAFFGLVDGINELKLSQDKYSFFEKNVLLKEELLVRDLHKRGITFYTVANNYGNLVFFLNIGIVSFVLVNYLHLSDSELVAIVMVLLYLSGPIGMVLKLVPTLSIANISVKRLNSVFKALHSEGYSPEKQATPEWSKIKLENICYQHQSSEKELSAKNAEAFAIGPINLTINKGEITFITGGNGSGKSTLAKVISQLYKPSSGKFFFDDIEVTTDNINSYRQDINCIFSDYHLFPQVLMEPNEFNTNKVDFNRYLNYFNLHDKVSVKDHEFSTLNLSDGQRRRLALIIAMLGRAELYIFDEWAADQDPEFKKVFYCEVLTYLRQQGAAVVVISHDDRFFHCADKLIYMEYGQISKTQCSPRSNENTNQVYNIRKLKE